MKQFKVVVDKHPEGYVAYQRSGSGKLTCVVAMLLASLLLVLASAFLPITVHRQSDLGEVRLGVPMQFVTQDQSGLTPPLPYRTSFSSPWEFPTRVLWAQLLLNIVVGFGMLRLAAHLPRSIVRSVRRHRGRSDLV